MKPERWLVDAAVEVADRFWHRGYSCWPGGEEGGVLESKARPSPDHNVDFSNTHSFASL